ncbi:hypothetical protein GCM10009809_34870 [Isoptericola hypogeus]|uniref:Sulfotransferase family protein n=1 Tax=Isoptericola hypogeus TaxID=300179 RepID=A0ABP4VSN6_9MICO
MGAPKSGTTYLQSRLYANRRALRRHDVSYPAGRLGDPRAQYWAALEATAADHGVDQRRVRGAWARLVRGIRRTSGDVVVSHEVLAAATPQQADRVLADLASTGAEVHLVLTARDLARELTSGWQETLKFGSKASFATYLANARDGRSAFMEGFDPVRVLTTWGARLPAERIHVVTAPPAGGPPDLLWLRFLDAVGVRPSWAPREASRANESVGVAEAQLLRRLNHRLGDGARRGGEYSLLVDGIVVGEALAPRASARITLGPEDHPWVAARSDEWIRWLREREVQVHGDLDDLRPAPPDPGWTDPDAPVPRQVADAAVDVMETLLEEVRRRPRPVLQRARRALARLWR